MRKNYWDDKELELTDAIVRAQRACDYLLRECRHAAADFAHGELTVSELAGYQEDYKAALETLEQARQALARFKGQ